MAQNFVFPQRDQPSLLPVDMRAWLPEVICPESSGQITTRFPIARTPRYAR